MVYFSLREAPPQVMKPGLGEMPGLVLLFLFWPNNFPAGFFFNFSESAHA
jgi:hypothetical protein